MSTCENAFADVLRALSPSERKEADDAAADMMLRQANSMGPEEYVRVARKLGYDIDVAIQKPDQPERRTEQHYNHLMAA